MDDLLAIWPNLIRNPEKTLKKAKGNLSSAAINFFFSSIILVVIGFYIAPLPVSQILAQFPVTAHMQFLGNLFVILGFGLVLLISFLLTSSVYYIISKLLGGKGTLTETLHKCSLVFTIRPAAFILTYLLGGLWSPFIGILFSLYMLYLYILAVKSTHSFSIYEAILVVLVPTVIALYLPNLFGYDQLDALFVAMLIKMALIIPIGGFP